MLSAPTELPLALPFFAFSLSVCLGISSLVLPSFHRSKCAHASKRWGKSVRGSQIPRKPPKEPISVVPFCWGTKREGIGETLERERDGEGGERGEKARGGKRLRRASEERKKNKVWSAAPEAAALALRRPAAASRVEVLRFHF